MSLFNLSAYVAILGPAVATVTRYATNPYGSDGKPAAKTVASTLTVNGISFQPVSKTLDRDAMGFKESDILWTVFSPVALVNGDRFVVNSVNHEVERVEPWNDLGGYCEALVRQLGPGET